VIRVQQIHKYDCEVLIAGGGPAGSSLAFYLANSGIDTLVLESKRFPRDKTCGDGVSAIAVTELANLGITELDEFKSHNQIKQVGLFVEDRKTVLNLPKTQKQRGKVIPRYILDNLIAKSAKKAGATYLENTKLLQYQYCTDYVLAVVQNTDGIKRTLKSRVLVGADGSNSTVARSLHGGKPDKDYQLLGLRSYFDGIVGPNDRCDFYFSKKNFPGIFWIFPIAPSKANVGSAMIASTIPGNQIHAKQMLLEMISTNDHFKERIGNGRPIEKIRGWPLKYKDPTKALFGPGVLLLGDAAGLINPLSGDGIQYALLSARWAAECLKTCSEKNDYSLENLSKYQELVHQETAYDLALSSLLVKISSNRSLTSIWLEILNLLFEKAENDQDYADIITGIFDGSHPSYKALDPSFIIKTILHGIVSVGDSSANYLTQGPEKWIEKSTDLGQLGVKLLKNFQRQPDQHLDWLINITKSTLTVGKHTIKNARHSYSNNSSK